MIDLSIGNPSIFEKEYKYRLGSCAVHNLSVNVNELLPYNKQGCIEDLSKSLHGLHGRFHAASPLDPNSTGAKIVVGHGATQILMGVLQYIAKTGKSISVPRPYWFRTLRMAAMRGAKVEDGYSKLVTLPNNPDGAIPAVTSDSYLDAVYHWPWYYSTDSEFERATSSIGEVPQISIFSLGKLSGHCGTRLGWAQVNDNALYTFLKDYVEYDSGGVSVEAQARASGVINWMLASRCKFSEFSHTLTYRKAEMQGIIAGTLGFETNWTSPGMFGWLTHEDKNVDAAELFAKLGIKVTPGSSCGGAINQCRINLGEPDDVWNRAIDAVKGKGG